jgi:uncharacterized protein YggU (UPF0235/DUF167 family)
VTADPCASLVVRPTTTGGRFEVRVSPRAAQTALSGLREGRLLIHVSAPPVDGAANDAVVRLVAAALGVPVRQVSLVGEPRNRTKTLDVQGLSAAEIVCRVRAATP